jgi:hypothetical protein
VTTLQGAGCVGAQFGEAAGPRNHSTISGVVYLEAPEQELLADADCCDGHPGHVTVNSTNTAVSPSDPA